MTTISPTPASGGRERGPEGPPRPLLVGGRAGDRRRDRGPCRRTSPPAIPDGLDSVAIEQGFEGPGRIPASRSCRTTRSRASTARSPRSSPGIVGIAIVFLLVFLLGRLLGPPAEGRGGLT